MLLNLSFFIEIIPIGFILIAILIILGGILYLHFSFTQDEYDPNDTRPLILYLREFQSDKSYYIDNFKYFPKEILSYELLLRTAYKLNKIGQFACVGQPLIKEDRNPANSNYKQNFLGESKFGARMVWFSDDTWKNEVESLIKKASLIIIRAGFTENISWEIREIVNNSYLPKTVIYVEFGTKNFELENQIFEAFRKNNENDLPYLSDITGNGQFIFFDEEKLPYRTLMLSEIPIYKKLSPDHKSEKSKKYIVFILIILIILLALFAHSSTSH
jgi:hypothetical protein